MTIDDKNRDEKLRYDVNRKATKISVLLSGKIDKYEYPIIFSLYQAKEIIKKVYNNIMNSIKL